MKARVPLLLIATVVAHTLPGCATVDLYEPERAALADAERGERLFKSNCARTCHPANAFEVKSVKNRRQLVSTIRTYYEQIAGDERNYTRQDLYDLAQYLDRKHYRLPAISAQEAPAKP
ncbi:MAG: cytochrome c [Candidatus Sericytochromatia bacterium]|nr:cytochrome c [Candidatus Sericytochromatia bacterium]